MHPFALVACTAIAAGAVVAVAWLLRAPRIEQARIDDAIEVARSRLELEFAKAIESFETIAESVRRHRARIDGAARGRGAATKAADEEAQPQPSIDDMTGEQVALLPIADQLAWAQRRRVRRAAR
jgi:hypothetical protein